MRGINILLTITLLLACAVSNAQESGKRLDGIWQLKTTGSAGETTNVPSGLFKFFDSNGNFSNMRLTPKGAFLSHKGTYKIAEANQYIETVENQVGSEIDTRQTNLHYTLSEDGNTFTLTGEVLLNDGNHRHQLHEVWERVQ